MQDKIGQIFVLYALYWLVFTLVAALWPASAEISGAVFVLYIAAVLIFSYFVKLRFIGALKCKSPLLYKVLYAIGACIALYFIVSLLALLF